jgi:hypothetical protein
MIETFLIVFYGLMGMFFTGMMYGYDPKMPLHLMVVTGLLWPILIPAAALLHYIEKY